MHRVLFGAVLCGLAVAVPAAAVLATAPHWSASDRAVLSRDALSHDAGARGGASADGAGGRPASAGGPRVVEYLGLRIPVPAGWEVHRLDRDPSRCVRYDRRAVYLGRPGRQPDCPARVAGRTEAVHVQPSADAPAAGEARRTVTGSRLATVTVRPTVDRELRLDLRDVGVTITGVYGTAPGILQELLRGIGLTGRPSAGGSAPRTRGGAPDSTGTPEPPASAPAAPKPEPTRGSAAQDGPAKAVPKRWVRGKGFDTCTAPSLATMRAWRPSFKVTNIYIGGAARGCAQPNLTQRWVREVRAMGYRITPTYVGLQAPCSSRSQRFTAKNAAVEGRRAAVDAARKAKDLGIPAGAPIYYDMEAYESRGSTCKAAVLRFVDNWVRGLRAEGYTPCMYSSVASGIRDVGEAKGIAKPEGIWFAHWDRRPQIYGDPYIPDSWWHPHRRVKQYWGDHRETHGGVTLNIDSNIADGLVH
ncbi:MAG TPA: DUF1906 domain-containing protein [Spirillospora sp.]